MSYFSCIISAMKGQTQQKTRKQGQETYNFPGEK